MTEFQKVLVVDDGARNAEHAISAELAGLGFASVTTSLEATDEVLELIPPPAAILLQLPKRSRTADYKDFMDLADRLKAKNSAIPVPGLTPPIRGTFQGPWKDFHGRVPSRLHDGSAASHQRRCWLRAPAC